MQTEQSACTTLVEEAGYFQVSDAHLFTVLHRVENPVARVLLVGPFASERHNSYHPWVRWARYLAAHGVEALRYDYRGIGESQGIFEDMSFEDWKQDVQALAGWLNDRSPDVPLILHGLELGSLLAADAFHKGIGSELLLWSPPDTANHALRSTLARWAGLEQLFKFGAQRRSVSDYVRELEQTLCLEVAGYPWTIRLWQDSFQFSLPPNMHDEETAMRTYRKPVKIAVLGREAAPLAKGFMGFDEVKDLTWLYEQTFEWLAEHASGRLKRTS